MVRANERYKMIAGILSQLGTALFGAGVVKAYYDKVFSLEAAGWLLIALVLMWVSWSILGLIESEN